MSLFDPPPPGDPVSAFAYLRVEMDLYFGNTRSRWIPAYEDIAAAVEHDVTRIGGALSHGVILDLIQRKYRPRPAGTPAPDAPVDRVCRFALASRVFTYLRQSIRDDLLKRRCDIYPNPVDMRNLESLVRCARHFVRLAGEHGWRQYFNSTQTLGEGLEVFFVAGQDEVDGFVDGLATTVASRGCESMSSVGLPRYGPSDPAIPGAGQDWVMRLILRLPPGSLAVPSLLDACAYEFFVPGQEHGPRRGRTVYITDPFRTTVREGVSEWVSGAITLGECLDRIEEVGPVAVIGEPAQPATALLAVLAARNSMMEK